MKNTSIPSLDAGIFDLVTKVATVWSYSPFNHRVSVRSHRKAVKLNRFLGTYPTDTKFVSGDEPVFPFTDLQTKEVLKILGIKA